MKLSPNSRFPHPVLSQDTSDYRDAAFGLELTYTEDFQRGQLMLACNASVRCPSMEELIQQSRVRLSLFVGCRDTYYREIHDVDERGQIVLPLDNLFGRVEITPVLVCKAAVASHTSADLSPEFQQPIAFRTGDLVGYAPTMVITVGRLKLEKFDSIFQLSEVDDLDEGEVAVDVDADKIQIQVSPAMKQVVDGLRLNSQGQRALLSSIYLPAVMEVLSILAADGGAGNGRRWKEVFTAKCDQLRINPEKSELLRDAQRLLRYPVPVSLRAVSAEEES
jgi:hypothetical protein